jgi:hypothetical protein
VLVGLCIPNNVSPEVHGLLQQALLPLLCNSALHQVMQQHYILVLWFGLLVGCSNKQPDTRWQCGYSGGPGL